MKKQNDLTLNEFERLCETSLTDIDLRDELGCILPDETLRQIDAACADHGVSFSKFVVKIINAPDGAADQLGFGNGLPRETIAWALNRARLLSQH